MTAKTSSSKSLGYRLMKLERRMQYAALVFSLKSVGQKSTGRPAGDIGMTSGKVEVKSWRY